MKRVQCGAGLLLTAFLAAGCEYRDLGGPICTEIGCSDGITVHLPVVPAGTYKVEIVIPGTGSGGPSYAYECAGGAGCQQDIFFPGLALNRITVRVTTALGSRLTEITDPVYVTAQPNGPDCPPLCRQATVTALLPG